MGKDLVFLLVNHVDFRSLNGVRLKTMTSVCWCRCVSSSDQYSICLRKDFSIKQINDLSLSWGKEIFSLQVFLFFFVNGRENMPVAWQDEIVAFDHWNVVQLEDWLMICLCRCSTERKWLNKGKITSDRETFLLRFPFEQEEESLLWLLFFIGQRICLLLSTRKIAASVLIKCAFTDWSRDERRLSAIGQVRWSSLKEKGQLSMNWFDKWAKLVANDIFFYRLFSSGEKQRCADKATLPIEKTLTRSKLSSAHWLQNKHREETGEIFIVAKFDQCLFQ